MMLAVLSIVNESDSQTHFRTTGALANLEWDVRAQQGGAQ
jgi:hypothetical protein